MGDMWKLKTQAHNKDKKQNHGHICAHGFTMVEVLVAVAILGTTTIAVFGAMRTCVRAAHHTRMLTRSVLLAESLLTEVMLSDRRSFETTQGKKELYDWQVQIAQTPIENLGAVHVKVTWKEQGRLQNYDLFSLVQMKTFSGNQ